jgi:hypothetical protein
MAKETANREQAMTLSTCPICRKRFEDLPVRAYNHNGKVYLQQTPLLNRKTYCSKACSRVRTVQVCEYSKRLRDYRTQEKADAMLCFGNKTMANKIRASRNERGM